MNKEQLIEEITQRVINQIKESKGLLTEMAFTLQDYVNRVDCHTAQIVQNWCLIDYVNTFNELNELKAHWQTELKTHLNIIYQSKITNGDKKKKKIELVNRLWFEKGYELDTNINMVVSMVKPKFEEEGIMDDERIEIVSKDLMENIRGIAAIMTCNSNISTDEYVSKL